MKTRTTKKRAEPPATVREGLPARFRMRHTSHYVDELLGDAPLRTVREIPISEIEPPIDDLAELEELERSIRRLGVIEPLLGRPPGRIVSRHRRHAPFAAAQRVGLDTVPCLVHDVDEERLDRHARRCGPSLAIPAVPEPPSGRGGPFEALRAGHAAAAIGEAALGLEFVAALLPAMNAAGGDRLRWGVLTDLAAVEMSRRKDDGRCARDSKSPGRSTAPRSTIRCSSATPFQGLRQKRGFETSVSTCSLPATTDRDIFLDGAALSRRVDGDRCSACSRLRRAAGPCLSWPRR